MPTELASESPIRLAVWGREISTEQFSSTVAEPAADVQRVTELSLAIVRQHRAAETMWDANRLTSDSVLRELAEAGFWGLLIGREHGGYGASLRDFIAFVTEMTAMEPAVMGLGTVHGCIGATNAIQSFGNAEQKQRFLPQLARGERQAIFAMTEPGAGSDLTAMRTTATRDGDDFVVQGEKLFITNAAPGRIASLVCRIENQPAMLICELPEQENEQFQIVRYEQYALKHTRNCGLRFRGFRVPAVNLLQPSHGNGLTIAYHGLNRGRVTLCAAAAGNLRRMLASLRTWCHERVTYGAEIGSRELVRRRIGRLGGLIVACDALAAWSASLLDRGYRGEMECIVAKNFASAAQHEAAIEILMKTHGGRSFLHDNLFGDSIHEFLVPSIYEGEGEMLSMAFFRSLVKNLVADAAQAEALVGASNLDSTNLLPDHFRTLVQNAMQGLQQAGQEIRWALKQHQTKLADRQCLVVELSQRVQKWATVLCVSLYGSRQVDQVVQQAAELMCTDLCRELSGRRPTDADFLAATSLGERLLTQKTSEVLRDFGSL